MQQPPSQDPGGVSEPPAEPRLKALPRKLISRRAKPGVAPEVVSGLVAPLEPIPGCSALPSNPSLTAKLDLSITRAERQRLLAIANTNEQQLPQLIIQSNLFTVINEDDLIRESPIKGGITTPEEVNDPRLGTQEENVLCGHCFRGWDTCPGHFTYIKLARPILHPLFRRYVVMVLNCVCNCCGGLLLLPNEVKALNLTKFVAEKRLAAVEAASKNKACQRQHPGNKPCRKNPIYLSKYLKSNGKVIYKFGKTGAESELTVEEIIHIFTLIKKEDAEIMGFENGSHPLRFIMKLFPVIPPCDRQDVIQDGQKRPDQLTVMYKNIVILNNELINAVKEDERSFKYNELINAISHFIDNTDGYFQNGPRSEFQSIKQRMNGKDGLIRQNSMGKRVNMSARTVISPDPSLKFTQIRIPEVMAPFLTRQVKITEFNRGRMTSLLRAGRVSMLIQVSGPKAGQLQRVDDWLRQNYEPQIGDTLERWLQDGDFILANRQPTLHKQSMVGYEVVLGKPLSIGLDLLVTSQHNADFDGDEMALHFPQTEEAIAEVRELMSEARCLMNSQSNKPIAGAVMDGLSGTYLLTQPDTWVDKDLFEDCISVLTNQEAITLNEEGVPNLFARAQERGVNYIREVNTYSPEFIYLYSYAKSHDIDLEKLTPTQFDDLRKKVMELSDRSKENLEIEWNVRQPSSIELKSFIELYTTRTGTSPILPPATIMVRQRKPGAPTIFEFFSKTPIPGETPERLIKFPGHPPEPLPPESWPNEALRRQWRRRYSEHKQLQAQYLSDLAKLQELYNQLWTVEVEAPIKRVQYAGRLLFSALLPPTLNYNKDDVVIQNGILMESKFQDPKRKEKPTGIITKAHIGTESGSIVHKIYHDKGKERTIDFLTDHPFLVNRWITQQGFTIGWGDCYPEDSSYRRVTEQKLIEAITKTMEAMNIATNDPLEMERLEKRVNAYLDVAKTTGQAVATEKMSRLNNFAIMAFSGAKGVALNIGQITSTVGQQTVGGKRLPMVLTGGTRCLPHFIRGDTDPRARGLCPNAFGGPTGLTPAEVFYLQTMGREGILDTALKTGDVGYLNRRVIKMLENVKVAQDGSVRDAMGNIIQEIYGDDGFDPAELEKVRVRGRDVLSFVDVNYLIGNLNGKYGYYPKKSNEKGTVQDIILAAEEKLEDLPQEEEDDGGEIEG